MASSTYKSVIRQISEMPPVKPTPVPVEQALTLRRQLWTKAKKVMATPLDEVIEDMHRLLAVSVLGTVTLEEQVPVSKVHQRLMYHVTRLSAEAMAQGVLPCTVLLASRWTATLDFGEGRVLILRSPLHNPYDDKETLASIVVEEGSDELASSFNWDDQASRRLF